MSDPGDPLQSKIDSQISEANTLYQTKQTHRTISSTPWLSYLQVCPGSISALSELRSNVQNSPLAKSVKIATIDKKAVSYIKELSALEIKETLLNIIQKNISIILEAQQRIQLSELRLQKMRGPRSFNDTEGREKNGKDLLQEIIFELSTSLQKNQNLKLIYKYIRFQWTETIITQFLNLLNFSVKQEEILHFQSAEENCFKQSEESPKNNQQINSELLSSSVVPVQVLHLLNKIEDKSISLKLFSFFSQLIQNLSQKQLQIQDFQSIRQDLNQLISRQINCIEALERENEFLQGKEEQHSDEMSFLQQRCNHLEAQLNKIVELMTLLRHQNQKETKEMPYYINPLYQKEKLQEKYMCEIIQLESDICLEKNRTQSLVDLVIEQVNKTHKAFYDLGASSYFIHKFDKTLYRQFKLLKPFDGINFDDLLLLKEEQEESQHLHKSTISTFSSISMEKLQFSREDESLSENG